MVLADYPTNPKYSIGKAKRKPLYEFTNTPGPIYLQDNTANLKYLRLVIQKDHLYIPMKDMTTIITHMMKPQILELSKKNGNISQEVPQHLIQE